MCIETSQGAFSKCWPMLCALIQWVHSWASKGAFFFFFFYKVFHKIISLSSTVIRIAEKCPLWWSSAFCQDAGLGESSMGWISAPQPSGRSLVQWLVCTVGTAMRAVCGSQVLQGTPQLWSSDRRRLLITFEGFQGLHRNEIVCYDPYGTACKPDWGEPRTGHPQRSCFTLA